MPEVVLFSPASARLMERQLDTGDGIRTCCQIIHMKMIIPLGSRGIGMMEKNDRFEVEMQGRETGEAAVAVLADARRHAEIGPEDEAPWDKEHPVMVWMCRCYG
jgi:hypothetical protein